MKSKVILTLDDVDTQQFLFTEPAVCIVGRAPDCNVPVSPSPWAARTSRRHCRLDIDPPKVTIRDLGSLNGTIVNGRNIGKRDGETLAEGFPCHESPSHQLSDGDEIRIGDVALYVTIEQAEPEFSDEHRDAAELSVAH
jgi:pSer/pThr/pTyr-binding forkhead associated (FHA) protein